VLVPGDAAPGGGRTDPGGPEPMFGTKLPWTKNIFGMNHPRVYHPKKGWNMVEVCSMV